MTPDETPNSLSATDLADLMTSGESSADAAPLIGATSTGIDLATKILGDDADPDHRRAVEDLAGRVRRAIDAGVTEAARYASGRVPEVGGQVVYQERPATILKVREPGNQMSPLDLLREGRDGDPEALPRIQHDRDQGWHWLAEPAPPDPTPADRVRAAIAAGKAVPRVGEVVRLIRAKPRSFMGVELVALRAEVLEVADVVRDRITLNLAVLDDLVDGLDPATASGIVCDVEGPEEHREGWGRVAWPSKALASDDRDLGTRPCDRCGEKVPANQAVNFYAKDYLHWSPVDRVFAKLCRPCSDQVGRTFFIRPTAPEATGPTEQELAVSA